MDTQLSPCYKNNGRRTISVQNRRKYDPGFKRNAVLLSEEPGRTVSKVAESLGVHCDLIYRWRNQMRENGELAFPENGKIALTVDQKRMRELDKKLKVLIEKHGGSNTIRSGRIAH